MIGARPCRCAFSGSSMLAATLRCKVPRPVSHSRGTAIRALSDTAPMFQRIKCPTTPNDVAAVILGGGETDSRRLYPLTDKRTLPAIPLGGIYRLIDVPMSNCINSSIYKIYILTQYNSTSLNRYLTRTYDLGGGVPIGGDGFMEVVAATQSPDSQRWADGAADSVRQWSSLLESNAKTRAIQDILVLPSDQVYRMDFGDLVAFHRESLADITIVCRQVKEEKAKNFGIVKVSQSSQITDFAEKPKGDEVGMMSMDWDDLGSFLDVGSAMLQPGSKAGTKGVVVNGNGHMREEARAYIASCGMYVFRRDVLKKLLAGKTRDFGRELIPGAIKDGYKVMAYHLDSFWEDIGGSIADFYNLNIRLTEDNPPFVFNSFSDPFFACPTNLPPSAVEGCKVKNAMIGSGCIIKESELTRSIIGSRSIIDPGCKISESILMGADYYEAEKVFPRAVGPNYPHIGVGANTTIHKAIVDKNARIGANCELVNKEGVWESFDRIKNGICIRDGILIVSKSSVIPDGTII